MDDTIEGCGVGFDSDPTTDEQLPWVVLFASADEQHRGLLGSIRHHHAVVELAAAWRELFGGDDDA